MSAMVDAIMLDFYGTVACDELDVIGQICERAASDAGRVELAPEVGRQWSTLFFQECARSYGTEFKTQREAALGSLQVVLQRIGFSADPEELTRPLFEYWRHPRIFDDSRVFLSTLPLPVCIVSNIDRTDLEAAIDEHGIRVDHLVTSEDVRSYKPRPELFDRAAELLEIRLGDALHVGDSLSNDVAGANAAGVPVAWVNRSRSQRPQGVELWAEVVDLVDLAGRLAAAEP